MSQLKRFIREAHRRSVWQVLGIYVVGAWAVWQVVGSMYEWIGLPDWVPATALVLLLVGLPIVVATAFVQEGGPRREDETPAAEPVAGPHEPRSAQDPGPMREPQEAPASSVAEPPGSSLLTWKRVLTAAVLAFAALGLAAAGYMGMRVLGIGPAGTLAAKGVLGPEDRVVLADFQGTGGGEENAGAVRAALRSDLEASPVIDLMDDASVERALRRMEADTAETLSPSLARELAVREGVKATLEGQLARLGSSWVVTARLVEPRSGESLATFRETADGEDQLIDAVDRLARSIREKVGETLRSVRATEPLEDVTTSSLEALRLYAKAVDLHKRENDYYGAALHLERALARDSTFAMAWRKLGIALGNASTQPSRRAEAFQRAFELRDRLTERERLVTEGTYYMVHGDPDRAIVAYRTLLDRYPSDPTGHLNLAVVLAGQGRYAEALEVVERGLERGLDDPLLTQVQARALWRLGRRDRARQVAEAAAERYPHSPVTRGTQMSIATAARNYGRADSLMAVMDRSLPDEGWAGSIKALTRIFLDGVRGRFSEVETYIDSLAPEVSLTVYPEALWRASETAIQLAIQRGDEAAARQRLEELREAFPMDSVPSQDRPYLRLARAYAYAGMPDQATATIERWSDVTGRDPDRLPVLPALALLPTDPGAAAERVRVEDCADLACLGDAAEIMMRAGRPDSAMTLYTRFVESDQLSRMAPDFLFLPIALERLARLHEERGNGARAADYYARFIDLWEDADPTVQPRVDAAERALQQLAAEGR